MSSNSKSIYPQRNLNSVNPNAENGFYEFDNFRLDVASLMLYKNGQPVSLAPKVIETLLALIERPNEIVGKEELMKRLWADSFVEEANLTQNIYLLRKTLGKSADGQDLIEGFRRRGYRFNGTVRVVKTQKLPTVESEPPEFIEEAGKIPIAAPRNNQRTFLITSGILLVGILILSFFSLRYFARREAQADAPAVPQPGQLTLKRLTPDVNIYNPGISPDGKYLAYELVGKGIWLKDLSSGEAVQIVPPVEKGFKSLQFSADGKQLYFLTVLKGVISRVAIPKGTAQGVLKTSDRYFALSPDGAEIAFVREKSLVIAKTDGGGERVLAERDDKTKWFTSWNSQLSWSPDGGRIAICGNYLDGNRRKAELVEFSVSNGAERRIETPAWEEVNNVIWRRDGKGLLVTASESVGSPFQIWYLPYPNGTAQKLTNDLHGYGFLSLTDDSQMLVAEQFRGNINVWLAPLSDSSRVVRLSNTDGGYEGTAGLTFAPDGKIVFTSRRGGNLDLWVMNADGGGQRQLTTNTGGWNGRQRVSPDNRFVVFRSFEADVPQILRVGLNGENLLKLTEGDGDKDFPGISPDGKWVYYALTTNNLSAVWKVPIDGGEAVRVSGNFLANSPAVSPDGKLIAYQHADVTAPNLWKLALMSAETGEPLKKFDVVPFRSVIEWAADSKSIVFMQNNSPNLWRLSLEGGAPVQITNFGLEELRNFALSPDNQQIAVARGNRTTEAVLIENFR